MFVKSIVTLLPIYPFKEHLKKIVLIYVLIYKFIEKNIYHYFNFFTSILNDTINNTLTRFQKTAKFNFKQ